MMIFKHFNFWKRFARLLSFGICFLVLLYVAQNAAINNVSEVQAIQGCTETPANYPQCGGTCNGTTYPGNHTVTVQKSVDGSCNVSYQCQDLGQLEGQCGNQAPAPAACTETPSNYPQCGGTCNGTTYPGNHTVTVQKSVDGSCNVSYQCQDLGVLVGQCGNQAPPPACVSNGSCSAPSPACGTTTTGTDNCGNSCSRQGDACSTPACVSNGSCSAPSPACGTTSTGTDNCGNSCSRQGDACPVAPVHTYSACGKTGTVWTAGGYHEYQPSDCAANQYLVVESSDGYLLPTCRAIPAGNQKSADGCGFVPTSAPPPACVSNGSCNASTPACGTTTTGTDNCGNACSKQGGTCACVSNGSCSAPAPSCGTITTGVDNCGSTCSKQGVACVIAQGAPVITNTNTNTNSNTNTISITNTASAPAPQTFGNVGVGTVYTAAAPVQYTALPKTGLPELAWSALAFVPAGFRMRRFSKTKKDLENHPSYIFEDRQFRAAL